MKKSEISGIILLGFWMVLVSIFIFPPEQTITFQGEDLSDDINELNGVQEYFEAGLDQDEREVLKDARDEEEIVIDEYIFESDIIVLNTDTQTTHVYQIENHNGFSPFIIGGGFGLMIAGFFLGIHKSRVERKKEDEDEEKKDIKKAPDDSEWDFKIDE